MRHHFFLSHFQKEAADTVKALFYDFRYHHCSAWIDMRAQVITAEAMRAGVRDSDYFVLVLTANVLNRPFCLLEACTKPFVLLVEEDARFAPFELENPACFPDFPLDVTPQELAQLQSRLAPKAQQARRSLWQAALKPEEYTKEAQQLVEQRSWVLGALASMLGESEASVWQRCKDLFALIRSGLQQAQKEEEKAEEERGKGSKWAARAPAALQC
eukprot:m.317818 g.317818  ORF g.317818 m.317818 type:complete len:215 (+) comp23081_c0_seq3:1612-2256(+)